MTNPSICDNRKTIREGSSETANCIPTVEECLNIIKQLVTATRSQATITQKESIAVRLARQRAENFLSKTVEEV